MPAVVWHCAQAALVGMWLAGFAFPLWLVEKVGAVEWQPLQSPLVGWALSSVAFGRESPAVVPVLAIMPTYGEVSWHVVQAGTCPATVAWPATVSVGALMLALPSLNPPAVTLAVVWQPEPSQSRLPIGMWLFGEVTIEILAKVLATAGAWQARQLLTPWCVPVDEYAE